MPMCRNTATPFGLDLADKFNDLLGRNGAGPSPANDNNLSSSDCYDVILRNGRLLRIPMGMAVETARKLVAALDDNEQQ